MGEIQSKWATAAAWQLPMEHALTSADWETSCASSSTMFLRHSMCKVIIWSSICWVSLQFCKLTHSDTGLKLIGNDWTTSAILSCKYIALHILSVKMLIRADIDPWNWFLLYHQRLAYFILCGCEESKATNYANNSLSLWHESDPKVWHFPVSNRILYISIFHTGQSQEREWLLEHFGFKITPFFFSFVQGKKVKGDANIASAQLITRH